MMPKQFVNPSPSLSVQHTLFFDFPCDGNHESTGVGQPPGRPGTGVYCAHADVNPPFGNVNLNTPGIEQLHGRLGHPRKDQGHPFMKELEPEQEDPSPAARLPVVHDQILDLDNGIQLNHTGRLSGEFVEYIADRPFASSVRISAVAVAPVRRDTESILLCEYWNWLKPQNEAPNVWFRRIDPVTRRETNELLYTAHCIIRNPRDVGGVSFEAEAVYKLVVQWKFWKYRGDVSDCTEYPPKDPSLYKRLGISGFDEAMAFEITGGTTDL